MKEGEDDKKGKKGKKNLLKRYNDADATKSVKKTAMKSGVDVVLGASAGAGLGALLGIWSPALGLLMIGAGHYFGDKSGLLRVAGAATMAYGIAKAVENRAATTAATVEGITLGSLADGAKGRLVNFKDSWMQAFFIDKLVGKKAIDEQAPVGAIDLSDLDAFEQLNKEAAVAYELKKIREGKSSSNDEDFGEGEIIEELITHSLTKSTISISFSRSQKREFKKQ